MWRVVKPVLRALGRAAFRGANIRKFKKPARQTTSEQPHHDFPERTHAFPVDLDVSAKSCVACPVSVIEVRGSPRSPVFNFRDGIRTLF